MVDWFCDHTKSLHTTLVLWCFIAPNCKRRLTCNYSNFFFFYNFCKSPSNNNVVAKGTWRSLFQVEASALEQMRFLSSVEVSESFSYMFGE